MVRLSVSVGVVALATAGSGAAGRGESAVSSAYPWADLVGPSTFEIRRPGGDLLTPIGAPVPWHVVP